jgi:hypothetical protein
MTICLVLDGCCFSSQVTVTPDLNKLLTRKVFIEEINSSDKAAAIILSDSISQTLIANGIQVSNNKYDATIIVHVNGVHVNTSIDSLSIKTTGKNDELLIMAIYSLNPDCTCTIQEAGKWAGKTLAEKLRH